MIHNEMKPPNLKLKGNLQLNLKGKPNGKPLNLNRKEKENLNLKLKYILNR